MTTSLYQDLVAANQEVSNWQSDLYTPATKEAKAIFAKHGQKLLSFKSNIDGSLMLEAPFQFDPYWQRRGM
jgi:hypothetical protein